MKKESKFSIVNLVCKLLNLGDAAKIENFVEKCLKTLNKEAKLLNRNLDTLKINHQATLEDIDEQIEDLENELETAYTAIDPDRLKNNADIAQFREEYLESIAEVEARIDNVKKSREKEVESHKKKVEDIEKELDLRQRRISRLSS